MDPLALSLCHALSLSLSFPYVSLFLQNTSSSKRLTAYSLSGAVSSTWRPVTMILAVLALAGAAWAAIDALRQRGRGRATTLPRGLAGATAAAALLGISADGTTEALAATGVCRAARILKEGVRRQEEKRGREMSQLIV